MFVWRDTDSWEAFLDGGPTNRVGAGRRLDFVFTVGEGLVEEDGTVDGELLEAILAVLRLGSKAR